MTVQSWTLTLESRFPKFILTLVKLEPNFSKVGINLEQLLLKVESQLYKVTFVTLV